VHGYPGQSPLTARPRMMAVVSRKKRSPRWWFGGVKP